MTRIFLRGFDVCSVRVISIQGVDERSRVQVHIGVLRNKFCSTIPLASIYLKKIYGLLINYTCPKFDFID